MLPYHFQVGDVPFQRALCHIQRGILRHDLDVYFHTRCWSELLVSQYKLAFFECFRFDSLSFVFFLCRLTPIWLEHTSVSSGIGLSFPFLTFSLVFMYIHVCVNVFKRHNSILFFIPPPLSRKPIAHVTAQLPLLDTEQGNDSSGIEWTILHAAFCRFWRLTGCGVLPCLAASIQTTHELFHCTATTTSGTWRGLQQHLQLRNVDGQEGDGQITN